MERVDLIKRCMAIIQKKERSYEEVVSVIQDYIFLRKGVHVKVRHAQDQVGFLMQIQLGISMFDIASLWICKEFKNIHSET